MLKSKSRHYYAAISDFSIVVAQTSGAKPPFTLEQVGEFHLSSGVDNVAGHIAEFALLQPGQYIHATCGIFPQDRLIRRATLDNPAKAKDPSFLANFLTNQFKVELAENTVAVLNAAGGADFSPERQLVKEIAFCGAPTAQITEVQNLLVDFGVYPTRVELGTLATVGSVIDIMLQMPEATPALILEIGESSSNVLICNGKQLDVARPIPFGFDSMYPVVQQELGLKDDASARKLFSSRTFDFTEMGGMLLKKLMKELQASTGFYEVQTGQTIGHIYVSMLPQNLLWIPATLSRALGVEVLNPNYPAWFERHNITLGPDVNSTNLTPGWLGLFGLMGDFNNQGVK